MPFPSPFANYLRTNDVPSVEEVMAIEALIDDQTRIAHSIADELHELDKKRQTLQAQLDEREQTIEQHRALTSSVRRFPDDILYTIFSAALTQKGFPSVTISHVCRRWRELALSAQSLWAKISITVSSSQYPQLPVEDLEMIPPEDLAIHLEKIEQWKRGLHSIQEKVEAYINRSGACPLDISFKTTEVLSLPCSPDIAKLYGALIDLLYPTSPRWKHVDFDISAQERTSPLTRLLHIPCEAVQNVKSLNLAVECRGELAYASMFCPGPAEMPIGDQVPTAAAIGALTAPALKSLSLTCMTKQVIWRLGASWAQLTSLSIGGGDMILSFNQLDAMGILMACPKLVECRLMFGEPVDMFGFPMKQSRLLPEQTVSLPDLRVLKVWGENPGAQGLPSRLDLPSLTELTVDYALSVKKPSEEIASTHVEWIREHGGKLSFLMMDYGSLTQSALLHCLERLPNIVSLELVGLNLNPRGVAQWPQKGAALITDHVFARLTPKFDETGSKVVEPCLCPKLRRLVCLMDTLERSEAACLAMVLARYGDGTKKWRGPIRRIEEVVMGYNRAGTVDIVKEMEESGVDMSHLAMDVIYAKK